ncbi:MAG: hypothetical protein MMC23_008751 [Stictis urceolatum]|nr:hypothetical protein [Stictis urceolata]
MAIVGRTLVIIIAASSGGTAVLIVAALIFYLIRRRRERKTYLVEARNERLARHGGFSDISESDFQMGRQDAFSFRPQIRQLKRIIGRKRSRNVFFIQKSPPRTLTRRSRGCAAVPLTPISERDASSITRSRQSATDDRGPYHHGRQYLFKPINWTEEPRVLPKIRTKRSKSGGICPAYIPRKPDDRTPYPHRAAQLPESMTNLSLTRSISEYQLGEAPRYPAPRPPTQLVRCPCVRDLRISSYSPDRGSIESGNSSNLESTLSPNWTIRPGVRTQRSASEPVSKRYDGEARNSLRLEWEKQQHDNETPEQPVLVNSSNASAIALVRPKLQTQNSYAASIEEGTRSYRNSLKSTGLVREQSSGLSISLLGQSLTPGQVKTHFNRQDLQKDDVFSSPSTDKGALKQTGSLRKAAHRNRLLHHKPSVIAVREKRESGQASPEIPSLSTTIDHSHWSYAFTPEKDRSDLERGSSVDNKQSMSQSKAEHRKRRVINGHHPFTTTHYSRLPDDSSRPGPSDCRDDPSPAPSFSVHPQPPRNTSCRPPSSSIFTFTSLYPTSETPPFTSLPALLSSRTKSPPSLPHARISHHPLDPPEKFLPSPSHFTHSPSSPALPCPPSPTPIHAHFPPRTAASTISAQLSNPTQLSSHHISTSSSASPSPGLVRAFIAHLPAPPTFTLPPARTSRPRNSIRGPRPGPTSRSATSRSAIGGSSGGIASRGSPRKSTTRNGTKERLRASRSPLRAVMAVEEGEAEARARGEDSEGKESRAYSEAAGDTLEHKPDSDSAQDQEQKPSRGRSSCRNSDASRASLFAGAPGDIIGLAELAVRLRRMNSQCDAEHCAYFALGSGSATVGDTDRRASEMSESTKLATTVGKSLDSLKNMGEGGIPIDPRLLELDSRARSGISDDGSKGHDQINGSKDASDGLTCSELSPEWTALPGLSLHRTSTPLAQISGNRASQRHSAVVVPPWRANHVQSPLNAQGQSYSRIQSQNRDQEQPQKRWETIDLSPSPPPSSQPTPSVPRSGPRPIGLGLMGLNGLAREIASPSTSPSRVSPLVSRIRESNPWTGAVDQNQMRNQTERNSLRTDARVDTRKEQRVETRATADFFSPGWGAGSSPGEIHGVEGDTPDTAFRVAPLRVVKDKRVARSEESAVKEDIESEKKGRRDVGVIGVIGGERSPVKGSGRGGGGGGGGRNGQATNGQSNKGRERVENEKLELSPGTVWRTEVF